MSDDEARVDWGAAAEAVYDDVVALRRAIHAEPEIGLQCPVTSAKIKAALAGLPLEIREGPSTTGFVAILRGGAAGADADQRRTVLLRGDMDALPMTEETGLPFASTIDGRMHACGHDMHTAMLVGAAKALAARQETIAGTIVFMFQPGEEGYRGARLMMDDGLLADPKPDAAFALHITPNAPSGILVGRAGTIMGSADTLNARIVGRGGHAAQPHEARDPIPAACEIVTALQVFVARQVPVTDPAVLSITKFQAGTAENVVPDEATLLGSLRALSEATRAKCHAGFKQIVEHVAAAHGCTGEAWIDDRYPPTINDPRAAALQKVVATEVFGEGAWFTLPQPMTGAEDFAYVLGTIPGAFAFIGAAPKGSNFLANAPLHSTRMMLDENTMARGVAFHCATALRFLERGFD